MRKFLGGLVIAVLIRWLRWRSEHSGASRSERGTHAGHGLNIGTSGDRVRHAQRERRVRRHRALPTRRSTRHDGDRRGYLPSDLYPGPSFSCSRRCSRS